MASNSNFHRCDTSDNDKEPEKYIPIIKDGMLSLDKTPDHLVQIVQKNSSDSPLLRLPAELRTKIFDYVTSGSSVTLTMINCVGSNVEPWDTKPCLRSTVPSTYTPFEHDFALARTCRQIYHETSTMLFSNTAFHVRGPNGLLVFNRLLLPSQRNAVKTLEVDRPLRSPRLFTDGLGKPVSAMFPGLDSLTIEDEGLKASLIALGYLGKDDKVKMKHGE
ncbi:hypothetical protein P280DRAFT_550206 [Massarina eburnea CBS 473.64]|uniref:DUF7730 domain-containing protein n=1 Tax=Massarina eburnea CBS 473.64 TaxID=1395130 RepID=A0A6A6RXH0_9PLEO|nr:hypothetical protein P280DRAFT_550206 [Massarina eburnea CBS 473.64]